MRLLRYVCSALMLPSQDTSRKGFQTFVHILDILLICSVALQDSRRPTLLFVHGSFHAAWCYQASSHKHCQAAQHSLIECNTPSKSMTLVASPEHTTEI